MPNVALFDIFIFLSYILLHYYCIFWDLYLIYGHFYSICFVSILYSMICIQYIRLFLLYNFRLYCIFSHLHCIFLDLYLIFGHFYSILLHCYCIFLDFCTLYLISGHFYSILLHYYWYIFGFVFNIWPFLFYIIRFYSIFYDLYSISVYFYCIIFV